MNAYGEVVENGTAYENDDIWDNDNDGSYMIIDAPTGYGLQTDERHHVNGIDSHLIDPSLMPFSPASPAQNAQEDNAGVLPYPTSSSNISHYISQAQAANKSSSTTSPISASTSFPKPTAQTTISPALLQSIQPKRSPSGATPPAPHPFSSTPPASSPSRTPPPAVPVSAKVPSKQPSRPAKEIEMENAALVNQLTSKESLNASLSAENNPFTRVVELLRVREVPPDTPSESIKQASRPKIVLGGGLAATVFSRIAKMAPSRYLKKWGADPAAMSILAFYLDRATEPMRDDGVLASAMMTAQQILVLLTKLDFDLKTASDLKLGSLINGLKKPSEKFKVKHPLEAADIKKLMRQCRNTLKDKIAAAEAAQAKTPQGEARKREASDEDRDVQPTKKAKSEPSAPGNKAKPPASIAKPIAVAPGVPRKPTADTSFFAPAPSRTMPVKAATRPAARPGTDALGSTLASLLGSGGASRQAALMAAEKAQEVTPQSAPPKVRLGPDGKPKPRKSVSFKPESDLVAIRWIEARDESTGHNITSRDLDTQEGRVLRQHAVEEEQTWYTPDELADAPSDEVWTVYSDERTERQREEQPLFAKHYFDDSEVPPSADEQNVEVVTVDDRGGAGETARMVSYRVHFAQPGYHDVLPTQQPDHFDHQHSQPPAVPQTYVGSPYQQGVSTQSQAAPPVPDVSNLLASLQSTLQNLPPAQPQQPPPQPPAVPNQDYLQTLLAGLPSTMNQPSVTPFGQEAWTGYGAGAYSQQREQQNMDHSMSHAGWHASGANVGANGKGGGGRGGGRGGRPPPQSSDRICKFWKRDHSCKYGSKCIDRHV